MSETSLNPVSEIVRRVVPDISDTTNQFLQAAFGPRIAAWGEYQRALGEMKYARRLAFAAKKASDGLKTEEFTAKEIPERIAARLAEEIILEENEEMANTYAAMLANAANGNAKNTVHPSFPSLLGRLDPKDILYLQLAWEAIKAQKYPAYLNRMAFIPEEKMSFGDRDLALDNLLAERLLEEEPMLQELSEPDFGGPLQLQLIPSGGTGIFITTRGEAFIRACTMPSKADPDYPHPSRRASTRG
jgi:hypothetical protein